MILEAFIVWVAAMILSIGNEDGTTRISLNAGYERKEATHEHNFMHLISTQTVKSIFPTMTFTALLRRSQAGP